MGDNFVFPHLELMLSRQTQKMAEIIKTDSHFEQYEMNIERNIMRKRHILIAPIELPKKYFSPKQASAFWSPLAELVATELNRY